MRLKSGFFVLCVMVLILFSSCDEKNSEIYPLGPNLYLYNNSNETALIKGYKENGILHLELNIPSDQVKLVGFVDAIANGKLFESDRLKIYKGGNLIYDVSNSSPEDMFYELFSDSEKLKAGNQYILVAPIFKWCGSQLCENN